MSLLAKTGTGEYTSLCRHLQDTSDVANAICTIAGDAIIRNGMFHTLSEMMILCCEIGKFHDVGKSNSNFQDMLARKNSSQMLRHEVISAFIIRGIAVEWFNGLGELKNACLLTILNHHKKFDDEHRIPNYMRESHPELHHQSEMTIFVNDNELKEFLGLSFPNSSVSRRLTEENAKAKMEELVEYCNNVADTMTEDERRTLMAMKCLLICSDVLASAIGESLKNKYHAGEQVIQHFSSPLLQSDFDKIIQGGLKGRLPFEFQKECENVTGDTLVIIAGCGGGKSSAAYMFLKTKGLPSAICAMPTTGTTTEHFKDYAYQTVGHSLLIHSRSTIDLNKIRKSDGEPEDADEYEAIEMVSSPFCVVTADTVLGVLKNNTKSVIMFPSIIRSTIIFDEIHTYDRAMFQMLLAFLHLFPKIPVVLMSATLQPSRLDAIRAIRKDTVVVRGNKKREEKKKYRLSVRGHDLLNEIESVFDNGQKMLWVKNRVDWASRSYLTLRRIRRFAGNVELYHSRFKYKHRSEIHRRIMDRFKENKPLILLSTQVCEISLDISTALLVTDIAPISSIIQRLGRLNRYDELLFGRCVVDMMPLSGNEMPYARNDLLRASKWVQMLAGDVRSQQDCFDAYMQMEPPMTYNLHQALREASLYSNVVGMQSESVRDPSYTINIVRQEDLDRCDNVGMDGRPTRSWLRLNEINVPISWFASQISSMARIRGVLIAPPLTVAYDFDEKANCGIGAHRPRR